MTSPAPLLDSLRKLLSIAERAGADSVWLGDTADALVALILAQRIDPRHRRSLARADTLASAVESMQRAGYGRAASVEAVRARNGPLSKSRMYALLQLSCDIAGQIKR
jgi:hypothetical protein